MEGDEREREEGEGSRLAERGAAVEVDEAVEGEGVDGSCDAAAAPAAGEAGEGERREAGGEEVHEQAGEVVGEAERESCEAQQGCRVEQKVGVEVASRIAIACELESLQAHGELPAREGFGDALDACRMEHDIMPEEDVMGEERQAHEKGDRSEQAGVEAAVWRGQFFLERRGETLRCAEEEEQEGEEGEEVDAVEPAASEVADVDVLASVGDGMNLEQAVRCTARLEELVSCRNFFFVNGCNGFPTWKSMKRECDPLVIV